MMRYEGKMDTLTLIITIVGIIVAVAVAIIIYYLQKRHGVREREASRKQIEALREEIRMLKEGQKEFGIYLNGIPKVRERKKVIRYSAGIRAMREYDYTEAISKFQEVLDLETDDSERCALLNLIGESQIRSSAYKDAEQTFLEMIRIAEKAKIEEALAAAYGNIGLVYKTLGEPKRALEYDQRALEIAEKVGNPKIQAIALGNIGNTYLGLEQFKEALSYLQRAREIYVKIGAKHKVEICDRNIALVKKAMGEGG
ncbi:Photosystem I assembly protein Ycf3 [subsurface metagenome]